MKLMGQRQARDQPFDCGDWSKLDVNATREDVARGFIHDSYASAFDGDFERAADALLTLEAVASCCAPQN